MTLEEAKQQLDDALVQVSRSAQDVADSAELFYKGNFLVPGEDMEELKAAIKLWNKATQNFLAAQYKEANPNG